ncbi:hypothetical protein GGF44_005586 [Coemansia sp. RSA 1694]|nr:hypothetical protein GGF44_005586 [Coemansia sp. RSA 1694]
MKSFQFPASVASALVASIMVAVCVSGQEGGVPTEVPNHEVAPGNMGLFPKANSKNPIDAFIATYSNRWVATALQSAIDEQSSLLSKKPELLSQVLSIEQDFVNNLHEDNALAHFSTFASKMEHLSGSSQGARPMAFVAGGAAALLATVVLF